MNNIKYLTKLFNDHYAGNPWIDTTMMGTLSSLTAKQAAMKAGKNNSIWQIVNHMIAWRRALLTRVKGSPVKVPGNNFFTPVKDTSPRAWKDTLKKFERSQKEIIAFLKKADESVLEIISPTSGYSYYELTIAILLHDTYHIGQIVLLKKELEK
ncbi:hypothetical protein MTYM_00098 [Methylococcales bacterium]|nr:hypothetical protein MTYM_00098 [Methylococcales bacterium]